MWGRRATCTTDIPNQMHFEVVVVGGGGTSEGGEGVKVVHDCFIIYIRKRKVHLQGDRDFLACVQEVQ